MTDQPKSQLDRLKEIARQLEYRDDGQRFAERLAENGKAYKARNRAKWRPWYAWLAFIGLAVVLVGVFIEPQSMLTTGSLFALLFASVAILCWQDERQFRGLD